MCENRFEIALKKGHLAHLDHEWATSTMQDVCWRCIRDAIPCARESLRFRACLQRDALMPFQMPTSPLCAKRFAFLLAFVCLPVPQL